MDIGLFVVLGQQLLIVQRICLYAMHILIIISLHLDVLYARTRHIKIAFLIKADRCFYKQAKVFLSLLKYVYLRNKETQQTLRVIVSIQYYASF